jgi:hypothetical protein
MFRANKNQLSRQESILTVYDNLIFKVQFTKTVFTKGSVIEWRKARELTAEVQ